MTSRYTYTFNTGDGNDRQLLGDKGANLCQMTQLGVNVPPGFVITTHACRDYLRDRSLPPGLMAEVRRQIGEIEALTGKSFGGSGDPLLVSVRAGSSGMTGSILNLGLNRETLSGLMEMTDDPRFAYDAYRRFIQMFGKVALHIDEDRFETQVNNVKRSAGIRADVALNSDQFQEISELFLTVVQDETARPFPEDVYTQLELAIQALYLGWEQRQSATPQPETAAIAGTAINIVTMVFGNMGDDCATGIAYTRNPDNGENVMTGEYLVNAQGEDVAAGIRTPKPVQDMRGNMPAQYRQLLDLRATLENFHQEVQVFEYTIERGVLYCLQSCNADMSAPALVKSSIDMVGEGLITRGRALLRIAPESLEQLLHPQLDRRQPANPLTRGLPASPGAASGKCVFDADAAVRLARSGADVILLREETRPEDIPGFHAAQGILTSRGGKTSHAAVVTRGMGKACVVGAEDIRIDCRSRQAIVGDIRIKEGDTLTIDGSSGDIYLGRLPTLPPSFSDDLRTILAWADSVARLRIHANVDTPESAREAIAYGAKGIGLCRTERMFNACDRLPLVIDVILAPDAAEREAALAKLFPIQRDDFQALFETMAPHPVTVRLLDPPMHEFLPSESQLLAELDALQHYLHNIRGRRIAMETFNAPCDLPPPFNQLGEERIATAIAKKELMLAKVRELHEVNPMLGHRGVRLGMSYPEIYAMQIRSIMEAAARCLKQRLQIAPEIMVPQVITVLELRKVKAMVEQIKAEVETQYRLKLDVKLGTMIETVRACTRADRLAEIAGFFSFGTNDLTQAVFSFSREDAENKFLPLYQEAGLLENNPFEILDEQGMGKLMAMAMELGRHQRPELVVGICGEHGGHSLAIRFCHNLGLDYVSCAPPRIPIARLAAAHASLLESEQPD